MERVVRGIATVLGVLATLSTVVVMFAIVLEVVWRVFAGGSLPGILELSESALVFAIFLGLAMAAVGNEHIAVNLLTARLPWPVARALQVVVWLLVTGILVWLIVANYDRALDSFQRGENRVGLVEWPLWPSRWAIVVGLVAMCLASVTNVVRGITGKPPMGSDARRARDADARPAPAADAQSF